MIIRADRDCALSVNGESKGQLTTEQTITVKANAGEQLIECVAGQHQRVEATATILAGQQKVVRLSVPAPRRFVQVDDGVMDYQQNLIWASRDNGSDIDWAGARQHCAARGAGWSLPTTAQLQSLYDESGKFAQKVNGIGRAFLDVKLVTPLISPTGWWYWSSEPNGPSKAWHVTLNYGSRHPFEAHGTQALRALCVRRP